MVQAKQTVSETVFRISLLTTGGINILPSILAFLPEKISKSYGIEIPNVNFELLLRHRAVLFGIVGGIMIYAAISKKYYATSVTVGLISMFSFIVLYFLMDGVNTALERVMQIDIVAVVFLLIGFLVYKFKN
ncbi:hypothetical protein B0O79_3335 [Flavobacteriaceae bacterium MAR_2009_75]|nr:hypothetical protein B0O79_3335 [Flavobacteriaceae bacterium MAR_2009_75]